MGKIHDRIKSRGATIAQLDRMARGERKMNRAGRVIKLGPGTVQIDGGPKREVHSLELTFQQPRKGHKDELCNRTACQKPGAFYFNTGTLAYYCLDCACQIRPWGLPDFDLFPGLKADERESDDVKRFWAKRRAFVEVASAERGLVRAERDATYLFRLP